MTNQPVVLVGGGGHAKVIADILESNGTPAAGCVCPRGTSQLPDVPWLGEDSDTEILRPRNLTLVHIAVGDNSLRQRLSRSFVEQGFRLASAISHRAVVSAKAEIGPGVAIMPGAVINAYAHVGQCAIINTSASVDHDCRVGDYAHVGPGCRLAGNVVIGEGSFLGTGASVIPGIRVGCWSVVGAGSVLIRGVGDLLTVAGVPARPLKHHKQLNV